MKIRTGIALLTGALAFFTLSPASVSAAPAPVQVAQNYHHRAQPVITGMAFLNGKTSFQPGETIRVVLNGTPGGVATFEITGVQSGIPMREVASGRYEGRLRVQNGMQASNAQLMGRLDIGGRVVTYTERGGVDIAMGQPGYPNNGYNPNYPNGYNPNYPNGYNPNYPSNGQVFVNVMSPQAGQPVSRSFMVTGQTVPGARVDIVASMQKQLIPGIINLGSERATGSGIADGRGYFQVPVTFNNGSRPIIGGNSSNINMKVVATDPRTNASREVEYNLATGNW